MARRAVSTLSGSSVSLHFRVWLPPALLAGLAYGLLRVAPWAAVPLLLLAASTLIARPLRVDGAGMRPTLGARGRGVWLVIPPFRARPGDLVIYANGKSALAVGRLVATAGDRVVRQDGRISVNGRPVAELGSPLAFDWTVMGGGSFELSDEVPEGHVWVLGDHVSAVDSRHLGPISRSKLLGRYHPLSSWGEPAPSASLSAEDQADLELIRAYDVPMRSTMDTLLAIGGVPRYALFAALRQGLREAGNLEREERLLQRAVAEDAELSATWAILLAAHRANHGSPDEDVLAALERVPFDSLVAHGPEVLVMQAKTLTRLGRWAEALASTDALLSRWPDHPCHPRIPALIAHQRFDEAEAALAKLPLRDVAPGLDSLYRAYLASARGELAAAAERVVQAIEAGFPERDFLFRAPLLAPLRERTLAHRRARAGRSRSHGLKIKDLGAAPPGRWP